jgi:hypothetical protein
MSFERINEDGGDNKSNDTTQPAFSRRNFLKGAGAIVGAIATTGLSKASAAEDTGKTAAVESPFNPEVVSRTLERVAKIMYVILDESKPFPIVKVTESISDEEFSNMWPRLKLDPNEQLPALHGFGPPATIYLSQDSDIHSLAHELAHYCQLHYGSMSRQDIKTEFAEDEAVYVQNEF